MYESWEEYYRRRRRFDINLHLKVCGAKHTEGASAERDEGVIENAVTQNVSGGGCYFLLSQEPLLDSEIEMEIIIPGGLRGVSQGRVCCRGKVIRVNTGLPDGKVGVAATFERSYLVAACLPATGVEPTGGAACQSA